MLRVISQVGASVTRPLHRTTWYCPGIIVWESFFEGAGFSDIGIGTAIDTFGTIVKLRASDDKAVFDRK